MEDRKVSLPKYTNCCPWEVTGTVACLVSVGHFSIWRRVFFFFFFFSLSSALSVAHLFSLSSVSATHTPHVTSTTHSLTHTLFSLLSLLSLALSLDDSSPCRVSLSSYSLPSPSSLFSHSHSTPVCISKSVRVLLIRS